MFIRFCLAAALAGVFASGVNAQEGYSGDTFSIPNERLRLLVVRDFVVARPSTSAIACCTTWNSSEGTTGCASFEGDSCPPDAPFEAYTTE